MRPNDQSFAAVCEGKQALTWAEATEILDRYTSIAKKREKYHCPVCRAWHLGRPQKKIKRVGK